MTAFFEQSRQVTERVCIGGRLVLHTPAHFGNGEVRGDALVGMSLLLDDAESDRAIIPGTTIAGALRNYLRELYRGYGEDEDPEDAASPIAWLFGRHRSSKTVTDQSLLIVEDALGEARFANATTRDGVRIEGKTGIAAHRGSFDIELLDAGNAFDLHFEVVLTERRQAKDVLPHVAAALQGFENGDIRLGSRKRRGYGECRVDGWQVSRYVLADPRDLCAWLEAPSFGHQAGSHGDGDGNGNGAGDSRGTDNDCGDMNLPRIAEALNVDPPATDERRQFAVDATFSLDRSSLLIRSGFGEADVGPDVEHLHATDATEHEGIKRPVVPGTSWAGAIRHRALRIANTIAGDDGAALARAGNLVRNLFGHMPVDAGAQEAPSDDGERAAPSDDAAEEAPSDDGQAVAEAPIGRRLTPIGSRLTVDETHVEGGQTLYQTRVRIDRFTGGAYETGLFEEAPVYGKPGTEVMPDAEVMPGTKVTPGTKLMRGTNVKLRLHVRDPLPREIGLLLLVIKDLWTRDLPIGGGAAVGRGRLLGQCAAIGLPGGERLTLDAEQPGLGLSDAEWSQLNDTYVTSLRNYVVDGEEEDDGGS